MSNPTPYRPEIAGLRAISVLAVCIAHANIGILPGGFIGVDIFFVISGFLITGIIRRELEHGTFSVRIFYVRRIKRILPALLAMILLAIPISLALMTPDDLENFGQSIAATMIFANNILLYNTTGYFSRAIEFKPLMHTWSLGVEESYYFIIPLMMIYSSKLNGDKSILNLLIIITISSFIYSCYLSAYKPDANFYLPHARAWQIGVGSIAQIYQPALCCRYGKRGEWISGAGLAAVLLSMLVLQPGSPLPSWVQIWPTFGAAALLVFTSSRGPIGRHLSTPLLQRLGHISYSSYLYHQPMFAFVRLRSLEEPPTLLMAGLIPAILVIGYLSWRFIEVPFRYRQAEKEARLLWYCAGAVAALIGIGLALHFTAGFGRSVRAGSHEQVGDAINNYVSRPFKFANIDLLESRASDNVLVIGNSFARDFINMGLESGVLSRYNLSYAEFQYCSSGLKPSIVADISKSMMTIFVLGPDSNDLKCILPHVLSADKYADGRILIVGPKNFGWNATAIANLKSRSKRDIRVTPLHDITNYNDQIKLRTRKFRYLDILELLSDTQGKVRVFTPEGAIISYDSNHLTKEGALYVGEIVFDHPYLADVLSKPGADHSESDARP